MKLQLRIESAAISIAIRCGMLRRIAFSREDDTEPEDVVAAVPKSGTPEASSGLSVAAQAGAGDGQGARPATQPETERAPGRRVSARRLLAAAAVALAVALLFLAYLRVSRTYPENSDESNDLLMAWDMLHGNVLLHGWYLSDVSFITTELPQYALLVWLFGLHTDTAHIAAAMTYTLVVIFSVLLARGRVPRREGRARMLLTAGLVFAPQLGVGVFVLLLSLGHIGTAVPLLLTWLVIDRCPPRWYVPVLVGLLLTWVLIADPSSSWSASCPWWRCARCACPVTWPGGRTLRSRLCCAPAGTSCPWPWRPSRPRAWRRWPDACSRPTCTRCRTSSPRCTPGPSTPG